MPSASTGVAPNPPLRDIDIGLHFDLPTLNKLCWEAIKEQNNPPTIFCYGSGMIRIRYDFHDDTLIISEINESIMRHELSQMAHWVKTKINKKTGAAILTESKPPRDVVQDVIASRVISLPRFNRMVTVPVFAPDGTLIIQPGYNKASGVIYAPQRGYNSLPVPDVITSADLDKAKELIEELICDFPFACNEEGDSPDHDNAIALFLLPFVRDMIEGPTPNHLFEAPMQGSGKGLLVESLLHPSLGEISGAPLPKEDNELRKMITSALVACKPVIWLDNVAREVKSGELAAALTMTLWDDRVLGASSLAGAKNRAIWVMTGNNVTLSTDNARRSIRIRLTPQTDKPEERTGFKHENQKQWMRANRADLVWAAHVICKNAIQQGLPKAKSRIVGSFEEWSRIMGSILECAGYTQFLANYRALLDDAASGSSRLTIATFAFQWFQDKGEEEVTVADLLPIAESIDGIQINGENEKAKRMSFSKWLKPLHEMITEYSDCPGGLLEEIYRLRITNGGVSKAGSKHGRRGIPLWRITRLEI